MPHSGYVACIPATDRLIKTISVDKHVIHTSDIARIPVANRLIETAAIVKHIIHSCERTRIPEIHITLITYFRAIVEHFQRPICS